MTMEQQNNNGTGNDSAGVLPMDTGVTANGVHGNEIECLSRHSAHFI